jgi:hypothetical protein
VGLKNLPSSSHRTEECGTLKASVFMVLGCVSNTMDRFALSNLREVLQKVDFST